MSWGASRWTRRSRCGCPRCRTGGGPTRWTPTCCVAWINRGVMGREFITGAVRRTARELLPVKLVRFLVSTVVPGTYARDIRWLHRQPRDKFLPQPYEHLASVLKNMGHERELRKVMIEKNLDHANFTKPLSQEWWWYNVFGWLIGYGYAPSRAFFISVGVILFGWWRFHRGFTRKLILPSNENGYEKDSAGNFVLKNGEREISDDYPKFNALFILSNHLFRCSNSTKRQTGLQVQIAATHIGFGACIIRVVASFGCIFGARLSECSM